MKYSKQIGKLNKRTNGAISIFRRMIDKMKVIDDKYNELKSKLDDEILELNLTKMDLVDSIDENKRVMEKFEELVK